MDYKARLYDPALGRFTQPDSIVPGMGNPQNLNRYSYVLNRPVVLNDPSGHKACGDGEDIDCDRQFHQSEIVPLSPKRNDGNPDEDSLAKKKQEALDRMKFCKNNPFASDCFKLPSPVDPSDYNPHHPDYSATTISFGSVSLSWIQDRYKQNYLTIGTGRGISWLIIPGLSISHVDGWIGGVSEDGTLDDKFPSPIESKEFFSGISVNASAGIIGGLGKNWTITTELLPGADSTERGFYSPQIGLSGSFTFYP